MTGWGTLKRRSEEQVRERKQRRGKARRGRRAEIG